LGAGFIVTAFPSHFPRPVAKMSSFGGVGVYLVGYTAFTRLRLCIHDSSDSNNIHVYL